MSVNATRSALALAPSGLPTRAETASGLVAVVAAALAMSTSPILVRLSDLGPFATAFWRVFLALPVLWLWLRGDAASRSGASPAAAARFSLPTVLAGVSFAADLVCWNLSVMHTTVANGTFFATTAPLWVVVCGWLFMGHRVGRSVVLGLGLCTLGGLALVAQSFAFAPGHLLGDGLGLGTGFFFGLYFLAVGAARRRTSAARVTLEATVVTTAILFVVAVTFEHRPLPLSSAGWAAVLGLALVSHVGGQGLLSVALGRLPAAFSSLVIFLEAIAAAGLAWLLLGEPVTALQVLGGVVILAGIWIARPRDVAPLVPPTGAAA